MSSPDPLLLNEPDALSGDGSSDALVPTSSDEDRLNQERNAFWFAASALLRWRGIIIGLTTLAAIASVAISLVLPLWYRASARVLPPESGGEGGLGALIGDLSPIAAQFIGGGGGGDYTRYRAILASRTMSETVVDRFDLIRVYDTVEDRFPRDKAIQTLAGNVSFDVDLEMEYLEVSVLDKDPERAAQIANFYVEELNRRNEILALEGAGEFRRYVEDRYREVELRLDSARAEMQDLQERRGVIELPTMAQGLIESLAEQRAQVARVEIEYEALLAELGPENPRVLAARQALDTAKRSQQSLENGRESVMPVALRDLPAVANEYAQVYQEIIIQQTLLESARPLLEQARFDEERQRTAVQVLDPAVPPTRKAKPKRAYVVLAATFSVFALTLLLALAVEGYRVQRASLKEKLAAARA